MKPFVNKILYGGGVVFDLFKWIIFAAIIVAVVFTFVISPFVVDGASMDSTLTTGEWVLLNKIAYNSEKPIRGDIVVTKYPGDPNKKKYVKRVVGLPGEKMSIRGGYVYINGKLLEEDYLSYSVRTYPDGEWILADNEFFLMGDNRENSNDSRYFGPVEDRFIVGRAVATVIPQFSLLKNK